MPRIRVAQCDGCGKERAVTTFDNGKSYCERCAEEVASMGWAQPRQ